VAFPQDEIDELKRVFPGTEQYNEGGFELFFLPAVTLPAGCSPRQTDLLLCPTLRDGYPSRLFFADRIQAPITLNWNGGTYAIERNWHAFSLRIEASGLRLLQTVKAHLRALGV
jgi:hypothetical protein